MVYRYDYGALMGANPTTNNFKPLPEVAGTQDYSNMALALLEAKGLTSAHATPYITAAIQSSGGSTVQSFQNLASLTEEQTAVDRGDKWGGSDDTMGKSWLDKIVSGEIDSSNMSVEDLYQTGFGRASDAEGLAYWEGSGQSIQDIAKSFAVSEEAKIKDVYHEEYGRDVDQAGLDYWMNWNEGGGGHHNTTDITNIDGRNVLLESVQAKGDWEQAETTVRDLLSSELGIHSKDEDRIKDTSLHGADGIAGTADDIFVDASEEDVIRMMQSGDFGASEIADKVKMQTAAKSMGDYGGGFFDVGATGIHKMLANQEMGSVDASGKWQSDPTTLAKTSADYLPQVQHTYDEDGNVISTTESNVWSLLKKGTQDYGPDLKPIVKKPPIKVEEEGTEGTGTGKGFDDPIVVTKEDVDYMPELTSDVEDKSTYGASKDAFDNAAAGIDAPLKDMMIRSAATANVGGSAEGVRLKRSKKFKTGESALGTKQLGRQLQLKSLNI